MKTLFSAALLTALPLFAWGDEPGAPAKKPERPRIEVCFVLDTTGSMSGLIEGAKKKIWSIANDVIAAKPTPEVRFGVIGYRDRGDDYVTKRVDLTDDLDAVYAKLKEFNASGGGDAPESVSEALDEAVRKVEWSKDKSVLKIIYLVGDAPPQEYKDGKDWRKVCEQAVKADLVINTVQCGADAETTKVWQAIANRGEGAFAAIPQDGNMAVIAAPQDKELAELSVKIGGTIIAWGGKAQRAQVIGKQQAAESELRSAGSAPEAAQPAASTAAGRASYNLKSGKVVQGTGELLDAIKEGKTTLEKVKTEELPEELQELSPEELKAHVEKKKAEREEIQKKIAELSKERDAYIDAERAKLAKDKKADSFDSQVSTTLRAQAKKKGINYE